MDQVHHVPMRAGAGGAAAASAGASGDVAGAAASQADPAGYLRKHIGPMLGERPIGSVTAEVLDACDAELRRCRDHCDGQPQGPQPDPPGTPHSETAQADSAVERDLLTLELVHLGTSVRRMRIQATRTISTRCSG